MEQNKEANKYCWLSVIDSDCEPTIYFFIVAWMALVDA